jgi:lysophospholipase L1-like esterase
MSSNEEVTIVAFGDSITGATRQKPEERWPEIVRRTLQGRFTQIEIRMVNAGAGGNTSREGLARIEKDVLRHAPHFVLFEFGNDGTVDPARHVSLAEFRENMGRIITRVSEEAGGRAIPMTFPPIIDRWHVRGRHPFYSQTGGLDRYVELYREATRQLARARKCPLVDIDSALRNEMAQRGPESCILPDGVHLTTHGNECVALAVLHVLSPEIEKHLAGHGHRPVRP